jgi:hypothetical protein
MRKDPLRHLTRGLAEAVEHTPAFMAMTEGNGVIPQTWGNLASELVEAGVVEPTLEAVCDFLYITPDNLKDPRLLVANHYDAQVFEAGLANKYEAHYREQYGPLAQADVQRMLGFKELWKVDNGKEEADRLQQEITEAGRARAAMPDPADSQEWAKHTLAIDLKCIERDAYHDGYVVRLDEFAATMLSIEGLGYFTPAEMALAVNATLESLTYRHYLDKDVPVVDITIGNDEIEDFFYSLKDSFDRKMRADIQQKWGLIGPFIFAGRIKDYPLIAGSER